MTPTDIEVNQKIDDLTVRLERSEQALDITQQQMRTATRRTRIVASTVFAVLLGGMLTLSHPAAMAQAGVTLSSLLTRVVALETKTAAITQSGTPGTSSAKLTITGDNVQIVDGSGYTDDGTQGEISGAKLKRLGNLIIGYNALGNGLGNGDVRTGSHNLILGDANNYSSYGGLITGDDNSISGIYSSVSGGSGNTASGAASSVSGGEHNTTSSTYSSVSGGEFNITSGYASSVSGGGYNTASNSAASVSGGSGNTASGAVSSVSGGSSNTASSLYSSVSGGELNMTSGAASSVSGGQSNVAQADLSSVSGGNTLTQSTNYGWSGGSYHTP